MEAYPLQWPLGYKRTAHRIRSTFKQGMEKSQQFLRDECRRLGATGLIVSTNIPIRRDGGLYTDYMSRRIEDPGVAIYFKYNGRDINMCCDQYSSVWENVYALAKGIEAMRGMERWGISDFIERSFTGFMAIEAKKAWFQVLQVAENATEAEIKASFRSLAMRWHPDQVTGNANMMNELNIAYDEAKKKKGFV